MDSKSHLIADVIVTSNCNDMGLLAPMAQAAKIAMEVETLEVVADKGYSNLSYGIYIKTKGNGWR